LIERQITRFAPEFGDCILSKSVSSPASLERWNPNLVGGDVLGAAMGRSWSSIIVRADLNFLRTEKRLTSLVTQKQQSGLWSASTRPQNWLPHTMGLRNYL
jgi:hypothetical protein